VDVQPRRSVLRNVPARRLWYASASTAVAMWSVQIAVTVHVLSDHSVATLAMIGLVGTVPTLFLLPVAGVCADRFDVRRLSLLVIGAQAGCLVLMASVGQLGLPALAALYAVQGGLNAFWPPARQRWLYGVVPHQLRHPANAAIGSINGLMTLVGAASGGLLSAWDVRAAILTAAALQVLVFIQLLTVPAPAPAAGGDLPAATTTASNGTPPPAGATPVRGRRSWSGVLAELADGVRATKRFPLARSVVWIGIAWGLIGGGYNVLLAGHITEDMHGDAVTLGLVYAADGASVIIATTLASRIPHHRHLAVYAGAYVVQGLAWAATFATTELPPAVACLVGMRLASGLVIALDTTILLEGVPTRFHGRIASVHMTTYNAVARISLAALGGVLTVLSVQTVGVIAGFASALFGLAWWWCSGRRARQLYLPAHAAPKPDDRSLESA
jgi:predicted MFS family arabinose efflux permease